MIVHDFASSSEVSKVISSAKGKLVATPSYTNSKQAVTNARTSKMTYLNDDKYDHLRMLSNRIQHLTRFYLLKEKFASENYKVMNYGIGGKVQGHWDSTGNITGIFIILNQIAHWGGMSQKFGSKSSNLDSC